MISLKIKHFVLCSPEFLTNQTAAAVEYFGKKDILTSHVEQLESNNWKVDDNCHLK